MELRTRGAIFETLKIKYDNGVVCTLIAKSKSGNIEFNIGDYVTTQGKVKSHKGYITRIITGGSDAPGFEITCDDGRVHIDYFYCFVKDVQKERDVKLYLLLKTEKLN
jgi:hypothetical protein